MWVIEHPFFSSTWHPLIGGSSSDIIVGPTVGSGFTDVKNSEHLDSSVQASIHIRTDT